jgi:hypothetical protein
MNAAARALEDAARRLRHVAAGDYSPTLASAWAAEAEQARSALAHAARGEGERNRRSASIDALRRVARAAKPFSFYTRSLSEKPGEYVMRVPKDEADEIQRAVDALWGTDDYVTPPPATGEAGTRGEVEKASGFVLAAAVAWLYAQALPPGDTARACSDAGLAGAVAAYLRALPEAREGESKTHG